MISPAGQLLVPVVAAETMNHCVDAEETPNVRHNQNGAIWIMEDTLLPQAVSAVFRIGD